MQNVILTTSAGKWKDYWVIMSDSLMQIPFLHIHLETDDIFVSLFIYFLDNWKDFSFFS